MWDEIYSRHYPELLGYAARACGDPQLAEDVAQEVFLKALQNADSFEDLSPSQRRAWLYRALKNYLCDCWRRSALEAAYVQTLEDDGYSDPGMEALENELVLQRLEPLDRTLFTLRYMEGYNASEISEMLNLPTGTIRSRLSRCRMLLKKELTEI